LNFLDISGPVVPEFNKGGTKVSRGERGISMADKKQIRIVKREARINPPAGDSIEQQTGVDRPAGNKLDPRKVINGWITELRRKKADQARVKLDQVFGAAG
jgi:hypothetical protein